MNALKCNILPLVGKRCMLGNNVVWLLFPGAIIVAIAWEYL